MSRVLVVALALVVSACLAPRQAVEPRYFSPAAGASASETPPRAESSGPELRLRRVVASDYLRRRMVWRRGVEVGFHDLLRWTQPPERYVEARLARDLFEGRGLRRVTRPDAASLSVALVAFDDVLEPDHEALVSLSVLLVDSSQQALLDRSFSSSRAVSGDAPEEIARALGEALSEAVAEVGGAVESALADRLR